MSQPDLWGVRRFAERREGQALAEATKRDAVLKNLEQLRKVYIERLRTAMKKLWLDKDYARGGYGDSSVSANDARAVLESWDIPERDLLSRNFMGSVFRGKHWVQTGQFIKSTVEGSHARRVACWRYVG